MTNIVLPIQIKNNFKVYLDPKDGSTPFRLSVLDDLSFSRVLSEVEIKSKTLHNPNSYFSNAVIPKANEANFSFTVEFTNTVSSGKILQAITDGDVVDIYFVNDINYYKIDTSIISGTFVLESSKTIKLLVSGSGAQLNIYIAGVTTGITAFTDVLPTYTETDFNNNYGNQISQLDVTLNGTSTGPVTKIFLEIDNTLKWIESKTVHKAITSTLAYPTDGIITDRKVSGNFYVVQGAVADPNFYYDTYSNSVPITITVKSKNQQILLFNLVGCAYTSRLSVDTVTQRAYDFRLSSNSQSLTSMVTFSQRTN